MVSDCLSIIYSELKLCRLPGVNSTWPTFQSGLVMINYLYINELIEVVELDY